MFTKTTLDEKNAYNITSGKLHRRATGTYLFTAQICTSGSNTAQIQFVETFGSFGAFEAGNVRGTVCSQGSAIVPLVNGGREWLEVGQGEVEYNDGAPEGFNYFAGYLLNENYP